MKTNSTNRRKPGRKPSGRVTEPVNIRMESNLKKRLVAHSALTRRPQVAYIEEGLEKVLPPQNA